MRRTAKNMAALGLGIVLSLIFLEVCLRIYNPIVQTVKGDRLMPLVNYDEVRQNPNIPGLQARSHIHQNSLGFRGLDPPADFINYLSIITIGGSTTRSVAQSDDRTWTALLGDAVTKCFNRVWINNAGFDGHTSFAHAQLIRRYINKLHPKFVLLLIGANELYADAPLVGASVKDREQVTTIPVFAGGLKGAVMALAERSEVASLALTLYRSVKAWEAGFTIGGWVEGAEMPSDAEAKLATASESQSDYAGRLKLLIKLLRDNNTIPVLMTQPTLGGTGRDPTTGKELSRLWYGRFWYRLFEIYNSTMRHISQDDHVFLIDLAQSMPKDTKYYFDAMHYTDEGARKMAEIITSSLIPYLNQTFPSFIKDSCSRSRTNSG